MYTRALAAIQPRRALSPQLAAQPDGIGRFVPQPSLLRLQRRFGNRYVQRLLAPAQDGGALPPVSSATDEAIERARGGGQALGGAVRAQMESAFSADFGGVRVHSDTAADTLNRALGARAFT